MIHCFLGTHEPEDLRDETPRRRGCRAEDPDERGPARGAEVQQRDPDDARGDRATRGFEGPEQVWNRFRRTHEADGSSGRVAHLHVAVPEQPDQLWQRATPLGGADQRCGAGVHQSSP